MKITQRKKDALLMSIFSYSALGLSFIFSSLFVRYDGGEMYGIYSHALAVVTLVVVGLGFGFQIGLVKINVSEDKYKTIASSTFQYWLLILAGSLVFYFFVYFDGQLKTTFLLVVVAGCAYLTELVAAMWQWTKRIVAFRGWVVLRSLMNIILVTLLIFDFISLNSFLIALSLAAVSHSLLMVTKSGTVSITSIFSISSDNFRLLKTDLWSQSKFFWASLIAVAVYGRIGVSLLELYGITFAEIGRYSYVYMIMAAFLVLPSSIQTYLMRPLFSKEIKGDNIMRKALPVYILIATVCVLAFWKLFPIIISFIIGDITDLKEIFWILAPTIFIVYIGLLLGLSLMTSERERERAIVQWISAGSNIILNMIFIPMYGLKGAAMATTGSYFILLCGFLYVSLKHNIWNSRDFAITLVLITASSLLFFVNEYIAIIPVLLGSYHLIKSRIKSENQAL